MRLAIITSVLVCVAGVFTALAQEGNGPVPPAMRSSATQASVPGVSARDQSSNAPATNPVVAPKTYVRPWKGIELKAHECFTDAEDIEHHKVYIEAVKTPEVVAAIKADEDATRAGMLKADSAVAPVLDKIASARKTMRISDAMATLTPEEKARYDKAFGVAFKMPEVQAAREAHGEMVNAMMIKIDPACAELNRRLAAAWEAARKDFYNKAKPAGDGATLPGTTRPAASQGVSFPPATQP